MCPIHSHFLQYHNHHCNKKNNSPYTKNISSTVYIYIERYKEMKKIKLKESDIQRIVKKLIKEEDKEREVHSIVHKKMDDFVNDTFDKFIETLDSIEDELYQHSIEDDGFLYSTQSLFFNELVDLTDHCIEEIKHGMHHHNEIKNMSKGKSGDSSH